jgi:large subunit ribosomal protein L16
MLAPKRQKYRKTFRGIWRKIAVKGQNLSFGNFGLKAVTRGFIKDREIEACRVILARATRKSGKFWIRIFPDKPYTKKPPEVTMGAGKGDVAYSSRPSFRDGSFSKLTASPRRKLKRCLKAQAANYQ